MAKAWNRDNRVVQLKWFVDCANELGLNKNGSHGGGWVRLASKCGLNNVESRTQARNYLVGKFGLPPKDFVETCLLIKAPKPKIIELSPVIKRPAKKSKVKALINTYSPAPIKDFYFSREWRALRYRVLREYGSRCQCCGATPESSKQVHVDHIKPRSKFPHLELEFTNLQVLCEDCNMGKSNIDDTDWRPSVSDELDATAAAHLRTIQ